MDINGEWQLIETLHEDKIASVAGLRAIERAWIEKSRWRSIHLVLALIKVILLCIVLIVLVNRVRQEVIGSVLDLVTLTIDVTCRFVCLRLIIGDEILAERVIGTIDVICIKSGHLVILGC